jgi:hypothetical protein
VDVIMHHPIILFDPLLKNQCRRATDAKCHLDPFLDYELGFKSWMVAALTSSVTSAIAILGGSIARMDIKSLPLQKSKVDYQCGNQGSTHPSLICCRRSVIDTGLRPSLTFGEKCLLYLKGFVLL